MRTSLPLVVAWALAIGAAAGGGSFPVAEARAEDERSPAGWQMWPGPVIDVLSGFPSGRARAQVAGEAAPVARREVPEIGPGPGPTAEDARGVAPAESGPEPDVEASAPVEAGEAPEAPASPAPPAPVKAPARPDLGDGEGERVGIGYGVTVARDEVVGTAVAILGSLSILGGVEEDAVAVLGDAVVRGAVGGDLVAVGGSVTLDGEVDGDVIAVGGDVTLGPNAVVHGKILPVGGRFSAAPGADYEAPQVQLVMPWLPSFGWVGDYLVDGPLKARILAPSLPWMWGVVGVLAAVAALAGLVLARPVTVIVEQLESRPATALLAGLAAAVMVLPLVLVLAVTGLGLVLVPFLFMVVMAAWILGRVAVAAWMGRALGLRFPGAGLVLPIVVGCVLIALLAAIPVISLLSWSLLGVIGFGAVTLATAEALGRERTARGTVPGPASDPAGYRGVGGPGAGSGTVPASSSSVVSVAMGPGGEIAPPPAGSAGVVAAAAGATAEGPAAVPPPPFARPAASGLAAAVPPVAEEDIIERATVGPRVLAGLIDLLAVAVAVQPLFGSGAVFWTAFSAYHVAMWVWRGTTLGGFVLRLRLRRTDGRPVDVATAVVRYLGALLSLIAVGLGFFRASHAADRLTWHDMIAGTELLRVRRMPPLV